MADLANRTTMKTELAQTVSKAYIPSQEADTATLRKAGVGDYRVAIDDRLLKQESDDTQALLQAEFDETQVKIQQNTEAELATTTAVNNTTAAVNTNTTAVEAGTTTINNKITSDGSLTRTGITNQTTALQSYAARERGLQMAKALWEGLTYTKVGVGTTTTTDTYTVTNTGSAVAVVVVTFTTTGKIEVSNVERTS